MKNNEQNTEQIILEAAEAEFLEKGYSNAKMLSIARRAGVAHSMLHYYFRSKENLFKSILQRKTQELLPMFDEALASNCPIHEIIQKVREARDRYVFAKSPRMPYFLLTEILAKPENREMLIEVFDKSPMVQLQRFRERLNQEIAQGNLREIGFADFIFLLITFDASSLSAILLAKESGRLPEEVCDKLMETYREHNMQIILDALRL